MRRLIARTLIALAGAAGGCCHPEGKALMPWFIRLSPGTARDGRYTFTGDLTPYPGFRQPAIGC